MNHVAEVENAADRLAVGVHQQVGAVAVAVDGLTAQAAKPRQAAPKGAGNTIDGVPQRRGLDATAELRKLGQMPHIPGQPPRQRGVKKTLQRSIDYGTTRTLGSITYSVRPEGPAKEATFHIEIREQPR